jgi:D-inositol-3-phosphate glycosyltransferase
VAQADVVHVVGYRDPVGLLALLAARRMNTPVLVEPAGMYLRKGRSRSLKLAFDGTLGKVYRWSGMFIATSSLESAELVCAGISPNRIRLRPNGVDVDGLLPLPVRGRAREWLGIPTEVPLVVSLGRISKVKNIPTLVRAMADLNAWLAIVGPDASDGALREIRQAVSRARIADRIRIAPTGVWGRDKAAALADADCLCLPSWSENFGNVAAEAAAVGIPVVVSEAAGVAEWLPSGSCSRVPPADVDAIRIALMNALSPAGLARANESASTVKKRLDWAGLAAEQDHLYSQAIDAE